MAVGLPAARRTLEVDGKRVRNGMKLLTAGSC
jgi:hypothetical protein